MYMMKNASYTHYITMFFIMILAGGLSTMNVWVDKYEDIRFSINDAYMIFLLTGWMFLFMGIIYKELVVGLFGLLLVISSVWCIRTQFMVSEKQYKLGMIPHHSMAIHMSKQLLKKQNTIHDFLENIIHTQEKEIQFMKK